MNPCWYQDGPSILDQVFAAFEDGESTDGEMEAMYDAFEDTETTLGGSDEEEPDPLDYYLTRSNLRIVQ